MILDIFIEKFGQIFVRVLSHITSHDIKSENFEFFNYFHDRQNGQNIVELQSRLKFCKVPDSLWTLLTRPEYSFMSMGPVSLNQA